MACTTCGLSVPEMTPRAFSFNSPQGACPTCQGLGSTWDFDPARVVPDDTKSLAEGAIATWAAGDKALVAGALDRLGEVYGIDLTLPFGKLPKKQRDLLLHGPEAQRRARRPRARKKAAASKRKSDPFGEGFEGLLPEPAPALRRRLVERSRGARAAAAACAAAPTARASACGPRAGPSASRAQTIAEYVSLPISRRPARLRELPVHRAREPRRRPAAPRDLRPPALPRRRRRRLSDARPQRRDAVGRRRASASVWRPRSAPT